ncbi:MAG TPA: hypothetical protein VFH51_02675, partial [Myxococcota bacterium]|nr:hypothetical protein [Myxococcota bacterium]
MMKFKEMLEGQHRQIDALRFHSLSALTEFAAHARSRPSASLSEARDSFTVDGPALRQKYKGGFCTTNAQALVQAASKAGARGYLLDVPYPNSLRPLKHELQRYNGPVHVDAAFVHPEGATHVVCGVGPGAQFVRHFPDVHHLRAHLLAEGYSAASVANIGTDATPTATAFDEVYRQQLGMRHLSYIQDPRLGTLGLNLVKGELFINSKALAAYDGPLLAARVGASASHRGGAAWPLRHGDDPVDVVDFRTGTATTLSAGETLRTVAQRLGEQFAQPGDFADNIMAVASLREALLSEVVAPSVSHAERALTGLPAPRASSWPH